MRWIGARNIRYLNPQAARLLGVDAAEAIGRFCGDVLKPCLHDGRRPCETACPILQARSDGSAQSTERVAPTEGNVARHHHQRCAVDGLQVQVIRDETELEGVRRARDSVLANISHEFRTPLAAQLASIELLREGLNTLLLNTAKSWCSLWSAGTLRLTRLIDNLLESVRIESGQLAIRHQSVGIAEVIEDAQALIDALLVQRRQTLAVKLDEDLPRIDGGWTATDAGVRESAGKCQQVCAGRQRRARGRGAIGFGARRLGWRMKVREFRTATQAPFSTLPEGRRT